ncbi:MAG: hypothetical protein GW865_01715 [Candidatus Aenigmarchaeota archaeon]|nr:hypothetical protein [Candidatus Aenigmarchaeota archaeon]
MQSVNAAIRRVREELFGSEIAGLLDIGRSPPSPIYPCITSTSKHLM